MKKALNVALMLLLVFVCAVGLASCGNETDASGLWENAEYLSDTEFGDGEKTVVVKVKVEEQSVTFTIRTDKETVGEALLEHKLISGEDGQYGMYIKAVNGITADYDKDKSYWAFYADGKYANSGVDTTKIDEKVTYSLEYTK